MNGIRIGLDDRSQNVALAVEVPSFEVAQQRKVEEADAPVGAEQTVLGIWIAGSDPRTPDETQEEAQHDLANAIALGLSSRRVISSKPKPSTYSVTSTRRVDKSCTRAAREREGDRGTAARVGADAGLRSRSRSARSAGAR